MVMKILMLIGGSSKEASMLLPTPSASALTILMILRATASAKQ
jgi:hypothetical protein